MEGLVAVLRRRGSAEAGAVYIKLDRLDGCAALYGPAPQSEMTGDGRMFIRLHKDEWIDAAVAEARLKREIGFDLDIWIVEIENRTGHIPIDVADL